MDLSKAWAVANDLWYMPATFFSFFGQNLVDNYERTGNKALKTCPAPGGMARLFNDVALGAAAVGGVYAIGADASTPAQLLAGVAMMGSMLAGVAVNFAVWGHGMVFRDKLLSTMLGRETRITRPVSSYMFPRLDALKEHSGPAPR